jgi:hypothetical protein
MGVAGTSRYLPDVEDVRPTQMRWAAGIYGLIVTASVLATGGAQLRTVALVVAVIVTVLVYWLAEQYAELMAHANAGHLPTRADILFTLRARWSMVSVSYLPLVVLLLTRAVGATAFGAALAALIATVGLLLVYGWRAGRSARLHGFAQFAITALAGGFGVLMIALKILLTHLH